MALFTISDLHLSFGVEKPMNIFGSRWDNYEERLKANWLEQVNDDDTVLLLGDFSWAMYLTEAIADFRFLNSLPGKKILIKGNHDYWWETKSKMNKFLKDNNFENIYFLDNNFYKYNEYAICGSRAWIIPSGEECDDKVMMARELGRLLYSIDMAQKEGNNKYIIITHYPPTKEFRDVVDGLDVKAWYFGHLHGNVSQENIEYCIGDINYRCVSADVCDFQLKKIMD